MNHTNKKAYKHKSTLSHNTDSKGQSENKETNGQLYTVGHNCVMYTRKSFTK